MTSVPCLGQKLTLYRRGFGFGSFVALVTLALFNLPWRLIPGVVPFLPLAIAVVGCYLAAALMASRAPVDLDPELAAARWL